MQSLFWVFSACAFAAGFALRVVDPLVLPIAQQFAVAPAVVALLSTAYALPYALAQPFLGPLGDRFGKLRCMQMCVLGLATMLVLGTFAPTFELLVASRIVAGAFAGGLIPLVLASLGDAHAAGAERQVAIGRMLFAIISGQMLGSVVAGFVNLSFGWRSALATAAVIALASMALVWIVVTRRRTTGAAATALPPHASFRALYGRVFENPKVLWLYGAVVVEGMLVFGPFPYIGELLVERAGSSLETAPRDAGLVLGAFGLGGLGYALAVRRIIRVLGVRRMCIAGAFAAAAGFAALIVLRLWWLDALAMTLVGIAYYMLHNSLQAEATELAPTARGSAVALFACGFFIGQAIGPLLFGALAHAAGFGVALLACSLGLMALGPVVVRKVIAPA